MGGGLIQLVAYGALDTYLTGNPQMTFFKSVYRRHTNFSIESIEQTFNGSVGFGRTVTSTINKIGDLVYDMHLEASITLDFSATDSFYANIGSALIDKVDIEIGGQIIDKHYGHWLETYAELIEPNSGITAVISDSSYSYGRNGGTLFQNMSGMGGVSGRDGSSGSMYMESMLIPLRFWFCRYPELALPLIALKYQEVKINLALNNRNAVMENNVSADLDVSLWVDYIYLDTDERRQFAESSHEYLIEQVQFQSESTSNSFTLNFKHPVKELIWIGTPTTTATTTAGPSTPNLVGDGIESSAVKYKLVFNSQDRFTARDYRYFTRTQVHKYHSGSGGLKLLSGSTNNQYMDAIAVYSFALKPEEHQPSGTCNFSRINNAQLKITQGSSKSLYIYAINYNIYRIMNGMGGLAYIS